MTDPVTAEDKFNYEREAIQAWLSDKNLSPQTGNPMGKRITPNCALKKAIQDCKNYHTKENRPSNGDVVVSWGPHGQHEASEQRSITLSQQQKEAISGIVAEGTEPEKKRPRKDNIVGASMKDALSKAFQELDPLRNLLRDVLKGLEPPKIVVVGVESSGKSSELEQLASLPVFPRQKRFCTRIPIHLRLRRSHSSQATLCVYKIDGTKHTLEGQPKKMPQENGWWWVQEEMLRLVKEADSTTTSQNGIVHDKIIVLEVQRPDIPVIDLVDFPGLTSVPQAKAEAVQALLRRHVDEDARSGGHSMYLAVVPASGDVRPNTDLAMRFIQENHLEDKTFGVFSKCDQVADKEVLTTLIGGGQTSEGYSQDDLGAVPLKNGWVSTMLRPPKDPALQIHNFERLLIQQQADTEFFANDQVFDKLVREKRVGVASLVQSLEKGYFEYLNNKWKPGALKKVFEKLEEKEFDLQMLGIIRSNKKEELAKKEVERRFGAPVEDLYKRFTSVVIRDRMCAKLRSSLSILQQSSWEAWEVNAQLEKVKGECDGVIKETLQGMEEFWINDLQSILTAESKVEFDTNASTLNIVTKGIRYFKKSKPKREARKQVEETPLIQLSHYKQFTDAIIEKCLGLLKKVRMDLEEELSEIMHSFAHPSSSLYLRLTPALVAQEPGAVIDTKVKVSCNVEDFLNALVGTVILRTPSPTSFQNIHEGISVGTEQTEAMDKYKALEKKIATIRAAKDGILRALPTSPEEIAAICHTGVSS